VTGINKASFHQHLNEKNRAEERAKLLIFKNIKKTLTFNAHILVNKNSFFQTTPDQAHMHVSI
jgi:hypothetical protein